ncbi:hypothetical protein C2845_PM17G14130 [Panicum miliaceum]|uniref:Uncharacterized protein n=1 Tax=Panicum miliaceum TaxID=4540 RepID=A0A3L6PYQ5_PANMI|nr:hypothetical protein C2845_PM17G14130 [Panicum miliaceum]
MPLSGSRARLTRVARGASSSGDAPAAVPSRRRARALFSTATTRPPRLSRRTVSSTASQSLSRNSTPPRHRFCWRGTHISYPPPSSPALRSFDSVPWRVAGGCALGARRFACKEAMLRKPARRAHPPQLWPSASQFVDGVLSGIADFLKLTHIRHHNHASRIALLLHGNVVSGILACMIFRQTNI